MSDDKYTVIRPRTDAVDLYVFAVRDEQIGVWVQLGDQMNKAEVIEAAKALANAAGLVVIDPEKFHTIQQVPQGAFSVGYDRNVQPN